LCGERRRQLGCPSSLSHGLGWSCLFYHALRKLIKCNFNNARTVQEIESGYIIPTGSPSKKRRPGPSKVASRLHDRSTRTVPGILLKQEDYNDNIPIRQHNSSTLSFETNSWLGFGLLIHIGIYQAGKTIMERKIVVCIFPNSAGGCRRSRVQKMI
jgi:hypothetical protein